MPPTFLIGGGNGMFVPPPPLLTPHFYFPLEREREMFYLTTHSIHFIYGYMVKDHSDSEKGNPLPPHRLLLSISSKGSFICTIPQTG